MLTPFLITSDRLSGRRHSPDPFPMSSHRRDNGAHHESNLYIREREETCASPPNRLYLNPHLLVLRTGCHWRLPLWLLLFSGMVSLLTLSFLLTGTVYPNSWTRFSSESLGMLTEGFYRAGQPDDSSPSLLESVSHATPDHVFAQISRSGDITMVPRSIGRPSSCGPATQVDNTVRSP